MTSTPAPAGLGRIAPALFVMLWASGFVVARLAVPHAPPLGFLSLRFTCTLLVLVSLILAAQAPWPPARVAFHLAVAGLLIHAGYLCGVWLAVSLGMSAGLTALIVNLQPALTAVAMLTQTGERIGSRQWLGLALGLGGVALVVAPQIATDGSSVTGVALCVGALLSITAGTLHQRRHAPDFDLRTGTFIQYAASLGVVGPLALAIEDGGYDPGLELAIALGWSVFALSIGSVFLMYTLNRRGSATRVASLFYLVPPVTALQAWVLFREPFGWSAALGMALTAAGVALVVRARG